MKNIFYDLRKEIDAMKKHYSVQPKGKIYYHEMQSDFYKALFPSFFMFSLTHFFYSEHLCS